MCSGCRETQTRCLNINHMGSARLNVGMPFLVHMQHARGLHRWSSGSQHFAESKTHTHKCDRKPTKLSQFPVPALKNDSSPYSCKAQQACSGPDSADPCGTGRELTICTDAFFPSFYLQACVFTGGCGVHQGGQLCVDQELQPPEDRQKGSHTAQTLMADTQAPSDVKTHELRAVLCDKA